MSTIITVDKLVRHLDGMIQRASAEIEHIGNMALAGRLRVAWVRVRSVIMKEWRMDKQAKDDYEQYIAFWESHLEEYYEVRDDNAIVTHDGGQEKVWLEVL